MSDSIHHICATNTQKQLCLIPIKLFIVLSVLLIVISVSLVLWLSMSELNRTVYWTQQVDWFIHMNHYFSSRPQLWLNLTELGDALVILPLFSFFIVTSPRIWAAFFGAIPVTTVLVHGGKALANVPRPATVLDQNLFNVVGEALKGSNSIPSGHSATVFVVATIIIVALIYSISNRLRWWFAFAVLCVSLVIALSRVAVGAHWPLDILFGGICGVVGGVTGILLTQLYASWWEWMESSRGQMALGLVLLIWSISLLSPFQLPYPEVEPIYYLASSSSLIVAGSILMRALVSMGRFKSLAL